MRSATCAALFQTLTRVETRCNGRWAWPLTATTAGGELDRERARVHGGDDCRLLLYGGLGHGTNEDGSEKAWVGAWTVEPICACGHQLRQIRVAQGSGGNIDTKRIIEKTGGIPPQHFGTGRWATILVAPLIADPDPVADAATQAKAAAKVDVAHRCKHCGLGGFRCKGVTCTECSGDLERKGKDGHQTHCKTTPRTRTPAHAQRGARSGRGEQHAAVS